MDNAATQPGRIDNSDDNKVIVKAHTACPDCGSHDALAVYADGHTFCFSCNTYTAGDKKTKGNQQKKQQEKSYNIEGSYGAVPAEAQEIIGLTKRKISIEACSRYSYGVAKRNNKNVQVANYLGTDGSLIGQKIRYPDKTFETIGKIGERFFGQHLFAGGERLIITEGEIDCLSVAQALNYKVPVVSLPAGCKSAHKVIAAQIEWLAKFDKIVLAYDMDKPGRDAVKASVDMLPPGKAYVAILPRKDANECLQAGEGGVIVDAVYNAQQVRPDGIVCGEELLAKLTDPGEADYPAAYPWPEIGLNDMTEGGLHKRTLTVVTAGTGIGKSTFCRQLAHYVGLVDDCKVGMIFLEESVRRTALGLLSVHMQKPLDLNAFLTEDEKKKKELMTAYNDVLAGGRFVFYDHFGSMDVQTLYNRIRYMAKAEGCDYIILDHITMVISGLDVRDERRALDMVMTQLRTLVDELGIGLIVVSHLSRQDGAPAEEGGRVTMAALRGSHAIAQLADYVIALERNQQAEDEDEARLVTVRLLKTRNKMGGGTGIAGQLVFNRSTCCLEAATQETKDKIKEKKKKRTQKAIEERDRKLASVFEKPADNPFFGCKEK